MGKAQAQTQIEHPNFETVWAALQDVAERQRETDRIIKESAKEIARQMKETDRQMKETDRQMKETDRQMKETSRQMKETDRRLDEKLGKLGDRFGEMIEYMVMPSLVGKFRELGFEFTKAYPETEIKDIKNNIITEVDITLENGDKVMIVEVKSKPSTKDISDHIKRMEKVKAHANLHNDNRIYLGAIAGMVIKENVKAFALKSGFYVIEPSGEEFVITVPKGIYSPREW